VFGFERRHVLALCCNQLLGVMAGKAGLAAERARVAQAHEAGRFAIFARRFAPRGASACSPSTP